MERPSAKQEAAGTRIKFIQNAISSNFAQWTWELPPQQTLEL